MRRLKVSHNDFMGLKALINSKIAELEAIEDVETAVNLGLEFKRKLLPKEPIPEDNLMILTQKKCLEAQIDSLLLSLKEAVGTFEWELSLEEVSGKKILPDKKISSLYHRLWTKAVGTGDYVKTEWQELQNLLLKRDIVT